jgi:DNA-binding beta-propeller fold protein YncE
MPFVTAAPPQPLALTGPVAALAVDAPRRRVFAAGADAVAVIDAGSGKLLATIRLGGVRALALEPLGGHVFAADAGGRISELDPDRRTIVRSLEAGTPVRALLDDSVRGRLYAAEPGALAVYDTQTFAPEPPVPLPGRAPDAPVADPVTGEVYIAFADRPGVAVVDPHRGVVRATIATPGAGNVAVAFDAALGELLVVGNGGTAGTYDRAGYPLGSVDLGRVPATCAFDPGTHALACGDSGGLTFARLQPGGPPAGAGSVPLGGSPQAAFDARTHAALAVWTAPSGEPAFQLFPASE